MTSRSATSPRPNSRLSLVAAAGGLLYVGVAVVQREGDISAIAAALSASIGALVWTWKRTEQPSVGHHALSRASLRGLRLAVWGVGLWAAARVGGAAAPAFDLAAAIGLGAASVASCLVLARIPASRGLASPESSAAAVDIAVVCGLGWGLAASLPMTRILGLKFPLLALPVVSQMAAVGASVASLVGLVATCLRLRRSRRLEMGVAERVSGVLGLCCTAICVGVLAGLGGLGSVYTVASTSLVAATLGCCWVVSLRDALLVSGVLRGAVAFTLTAAPLVVVVTRLARSLPSLSGGVSIVGGALALAAGLFVRRLATRLAGEQARWLRSLKAASQAALEPDPSTAIDATLAALQRLEPTVQTRPELWRLDPNEVIAVDVAGYLHREKSEMPREVYQLVRDEPEGVLRRSVLLAAQVRRPDVRSSLAWLDSRQACLAVLVGQGEDDYGLLVFPQGSRRSELSLEEACACRQLASRLAAVLAVSSSLVRARTREGQAVAELAKLREKIQAAEHRVSLAMKASTNLPQWLSRSARIGMFSARARAASERALYLAKRADPILVEVPVGGNALAWACHIHLLSEGRNGPLVVVDGTLLEQASGSGPASEFFEQAEAGTLVLLQAQALTQDDQRQWLEALLEFQREGRSPVKWVFSCPTQFSANPEFLRGPLMQALGVQTIRLPTLLERPEDVRGLVLEQLCRSGARGSQDVLGCDVQAMAELVEHCWPGNEKELESIVARAAERAEGPTVRLRDLTGISNNVRGPLVGNAGADELVRLPARRGPAGALEMSPISPALEPSTADLRTVARRRRRK